MSIDSLITGRLYGQPEQRDSKAGKPFVTAKLRVPTGDGKQQFLKVIAFSETVQRALLALDEGEACSVVGPLSASGYTNKSGEPCASLSVVAEQVLSAHHVRRKAAAMRQRENEDARPRAPVGDPADDPF